MVVLQTEGQRLLSIERSDLYVSYFGPEGRTPRQACDMKCKSVLIFYFNFIFYVFSLLRFSLRSVSDLNTITKPSL